MFIAHPFPPVSSALLLRGSAILLATLVGVHAVEAAELISAPASAALMPPSGDSSYPAASDDGRWVVFATDSDNLVAGDSNGLVDIIRVDRQTGAQVIASQADGVPANGTVLWGSPDISNDGRYVVFVSRASNLVAGDSNGRADLFRKDLQTGDIQRLSWLNPDADGPVGFSLTGDGSTLMVVDYAANWINGAPNTLQVLKVDWQTLQMTMIPTTAPLIAQGQVPFAVSSDGRCLVYSAQWGTDVRIRVRDLQTGNEDWGDYTADGLPPNGRTQAFVIDANCTSIAFTSTATNLMGPQTQAPYHVYRRLLGTTQLEKVSERSPGENFSESLRLTMSADGHHFLYNRALNDENYRTLGSWTEYRDMAQPFAQRADWIDGEVTFIDNQGGALTRSDANVAGDLNGLSDVHASPAAGAPMQMLATPAATAPVLAANGASFLASESARSEVGDGRWVAFDSLATNLLAGIVESDTVRDVYLRDRSNGQTSRLLAAFGIQPTRDVYLGDITPDGRYAVISSCDSHLVANDHNNQCDMFVVDRVGMTVELVNVDSDEAQAEFESTYPSPGQITDDGRFVVFMSMAANLSPDSSVGAQVYIRDRATGTTRMAMQGAAGGMDGDSYLIDLANGGHYAVLGNTATNGDPNCYMVGVDLLTGARDCPTVDEYGAHINNAGIVTLSADGRFLLYSDPWDATPHVLLKDRSSGQVRVVNVPLDDAPGQQVQYLSGNGRYALAVTYTTWPEASVGVYDLILDRWVTSPGVTSSPYGISINHSGSALHLGTRLALDRADGRPGVPNVYREEYAGDGVFGGGWQGGFE